MKKVNSKRLTRSTARVKARGEVFTPLWLVTETLNKVPQVMFRDSTKNVLDPACGNGNFLVAVVERKLRNGLDPVTSLRTTYGVDIMPDNVVECRQRIFKVVVEGGSISSTDTHAFQNIVRALKKNIQHGDTLRFDIDDIFSDEPSEELINFRNENQDFVALDSDG